MKEEPIDCSGFHFYCPEDRSYVIFDPESQEENDRLDTFLGASEIWQRIVAKHRNEAATADEKIGEIRAFTQYEQAGFTETGEGIVVVVTGAIGHHGGKCMVHGQWFAVRMKAGAEAELQQDLEAELRERQARVKQQIAEAGGDVKDG